MPKKFSVFSNKLIDNVILGMYLRKAKKNSPSHHRK